MAQHDHPEWRDRMRVRFDFNFAMASAVGDEHGLTEEGTGGLADRGRQGHESLRRKRQAGDLAWMELPYQQDDAAAVLAYADSVRGRFDNFVVLGIGGSALGNTAISTALNPPYYNMLPAAQRRDRPRLFVLDNVDPDQFAALLAMVDLDR